MVSLSFPAFPCPGTAGRKRNVILVCVEGLKSAASIRKSEISERPKADVWKKCRKKWSYYVQHCIVHMLNKMPLKSLENPEIKFERSKRKHRNPRAAKNSRYLRLKKTIWLCMTLWNPMSHQCRLKSTDPGRHAQSFLGSIQIRSANQKSKVRNPKSIPKLDFCLRVWDWTFDFGGPRKITSRQFGDDGLMVQGSIWDSRLDGGNVVVVGGCGRRLLCSSILSCARLHVGLWKPMVTTHFHCEIQPKTLSQDKLESLPKKGPAEHSCCTKSNVLSHLVILASRQLRSSRFPKHPLGVREDQALQAPRSQGKSCNFRDLEGAVKDRNLIWAVCSTSASPTQTFER